MPPTMDDVREQLRRAKEPLRALIDPAELREFSRQFDLPPDVLLADVPIRETSIGGIVCEWFEAGSGPDVLMYLHGGGFMVPPNNAHRLLVQKMARRLGAAAVLPRYRLAPEHPFPAGLEDCVAVYSALAGDHRRILLSGDSSGGGLAVSVVMKASEAGLPAPAAMYLMSPFTDLACSGASVFSRAAIDPIGTPEALLQKAYYYLAGRSPTDPLASPFYGNLCGLPPTLIDVGSDEIMLDDSLRFAARAREQGSDVECRVHHGMPHVFPTIPFVAECEQALAKGADFLVGRITAER